MIETITFDTENSKITIAFQDGSFKEYTKDNAAQYLIDNPDRTADVVAMGWN
jgi:hypothetical protein